MAFNPFTSFRKNQKFWMVTILLLSMVTFVLCTGVGGDLSDWLIRQVAPRQGQAAAQIEGANVYRRELEELRTRRNIADSFMREATKFAILQVDDRMKESGKIPEAKRAQVLQEMTLVKADLTERLGRKRYFEGGVKYDDLLNFMVWLHEADRLGVTLDPDMMRDLVYQAVHGTYSGFSDNASRQIQYKVRQNVYSATDEVIYRALYDEFRVEVTRLALLEAQPELILRPGSFRLVSRLPQIRKPVAPEQIWEHYRKNRSEFDVTLVPVKVEDFIKDIPAPTEAQLQDFYERNRDNEFNPTSPVPSFKFPPRMKVQWVSADPESSYYRNFAKLATTLALYNPVALTPVLPANLAALQYASRSAAWNASLQRNYDVFKRNDPTRFEAPSLADPYFVLPLLSSIDKSTPATAASLVAMAACPGLAFAAPLSYEADIYFRHQKEMAAVLPGEVKKRWPIAASVVLAGAAGQQIPVAKGVIDLAEQPQFLPLALVRKELRDKIEEMIAREWASTNMREVQAKLKLPGTQGNKKGMERRLTELTKRYGLEVKSTEHFHNRFDIDKAPSLQPLLKSYEKYYTKVNHIEGRAGTETMLREDDFWRLFFDSSIGHSIENAGLYFARPWPPYVKQKANPAAVVATSAVGEGQIVPLFEIAERPFLFWQTEFEPGRLPHSLDEVRDKVVMAWKLKEAREKKALPTAKAIARALQDAGKNGLETAIHEQAAKLGHELIILKKIAPQVPQPRASFRAPQTYGPYELPKSAFVYPRTDMVQQLLKLYDLSRDSKEALRIDDKELDDLNEELLRRKLEGKQVQVLTNRPHSYFYVAAVTDAPVPRLYDFTKAYEAVVSNFGTDEFVNHFQEEAAKRYRDSLMEQLRKAADVKPNTDAQKSFDSGG